MQQILAPISVGELWDKITILKIKQQHVQSESAAVNILYELQQLEALVPAQTDLEILDLVQQLSQVNLNIWHAEEQIRQLYVRNDFNSEFCIRTQEILHNNDHRAHIKRRINQITHSDICEEKIYAHMAHAGIS